MSDRRPPHIIRPRKLPSVRSLRVTTGRNQLGERAVVVGHPGVWSAHAHCRITAVHAAAWKVWFTPAARKRPTWTMWRATLVRSLDDDTFEVSLDERYLPTLRPDLT